MAKDKDDIKWKGLSLSHISRLEQILCRCRIRSEIAATDLDVVRTIGNLCAKTRDHIGDMVGAKAKPQNQELAAYLAGSAAAVAPQKVSEFLAGKKSDPKWIDHGHRIFLFLMQGTGPIGAAQATDEQKRVREIVDRVDSYFFRDYIPPKEPTTFLSRDRLCHDLPITETEFSGELAWVVRDAMLSREAGSTEKARIVFASGGADFLFGCDSRDPAAREVAAGIANELIEACFLYPDDSTDASRSVDRFVSSNPAIADKIQRIALRDTGPSWWQFLDPIIGFIHIRHTSSELSRLLIQRLLNSGQTRSGPIALEGTLAELKLFEGWLGQVAPSTP